MGKFDGILICTDLDGTLYRNDKTISRENKEAIEYFKREGGYFTFITGRMPYYSLDAYRAVNPNAPFGCINGGGLYDGERGEYVFTRILEKRVTELIDYVEERFSGVGIQVCNFYKTYFVKENTTTVNFRKITGLPYISADYHRIEDDFAKIIFCSDRNEDILGIGETIKSHPLSSDFDFIRTDKTLCELLPKGINKGVAIKKLAEHLKLDPKKTIGIGDYNNDVPMFEAAGVGVAVSNAAKEALDAADIVTVSNEEHAIAKIIYDLDSGALTL